MERVSYASPSADSGYPASTSTQEPGVRDRARRRISSQRDRPTTVLDSDETRAEERAGARAGHECGRRLWIVEVPTAQRIVEAGVAIRQSRNFLDDFRLLVVRRVVDTNQIVVHDLVRNGQVRYFELTGKIGERDVLQGVHELCGRVTLLDQKGLLGATAVGDLVEVVERGANADDERADGRLVLFEKPRTEISSPLLSQIRCRQRYRSRVSPESPTATKRLCCLIAGIRAIDFDKRASSPSASL